MLRQSQGVTPPLGAELQTVLVGRYKSTKEKYEGVRLGCNAGGGGLMARVGPHAANATMTFLLVALTYDGKRSRK